MCRYNIVSRILLILTFITFALAAPVLVQEKRQASVNEVYAPRDMITVLGKRAIGDDLPILLGEVEDHVPEVHVPQPNLAGVHVPEVDAPPPNAAENHVPDVDAQLPNQPLNLAGVHVPVHAPPPDLAGVHGPEMHMPMDFGSQWLPEEQAPEVYDPPRGPGDSDRESVGSVESDSESEDEDYMTRFNNGWDVDLGFGVG